MNLTASLQTFWKALLIAVFALSFTVLSPSYEARAADPQPTQITNIICNAVNQLTGNIGRSIAILIVISLAISLFLGKVSWGMAIAVAVGMGILFGAKDVVDLLSGDTMCQ